MEPVNFAVGYAVFGIVAIGLLVALFVAGEWIHWRITGTPPSHFTQHIIESIKGIVYDAVG